MSVVATALATSPSVALDAIATKLGARAPALVLVFASPVHPLDALVRATRARFPAACVLGASSAGEFNEGGDAKQAISIFAIAGDIVAFGGFGGGLKENPERAVAEALKGLPREVPGYPHATAILLLDALSCARSIRAPPGTCGRSGPARSRRRAGSTSTRSRGETR